MSRRSETVLRNCNLWNLGRMLWLTAIAASAPVALALACMALLGLVAGVLWTAWMAKLEQAVAFMFATPVRTPHAWAGLTHAQVDLDRYVADYAMGEEKDADSYVAPALVAATFAVAAVVAAPADVDAAPVVESPVVDIKAVVNDVLNNCTDEQLREECRAQRIKGYNSRWTRTTMLKKLSAQ